MPVQLDRAREKLTALMGDTCRVIRDTDGTADDVLDPDTLILEPPDPDASTVYTGQCLVTPMGTGRTTGVESSIGDTIVVIGAYKVHLPYDSPVVLRNDRVIILTSEDPQLVGLSLRVVEPERTSFLVQRVLLCEVIR